jgi:hypothetical protein
MSDEFDGTFADHVSEAIELCVNELDMTFPLHIVTIDMGGHLMAITIHDDGKTVDIYNPGYRASELMYPIHVLVVDCDGQSVTLTAMLKDEPMRTLH